MTFACALAMAMMVSKGQTGFSGGKDITDLGPDQCSARYPAGPIFPYRLSRQRCMVSSLLARSYPRAIATFRTAVRLPDLRDRAGAGRKKTKTDQIWAYVCDDRLGVAMTCRLSPMFRLSIARPSDQKRICTALPVSCRLTAMVPKLRWLGVITRPTWRSAGRTCAGSSTNWPRARPWASVRRAPPCLGG